MKRQHLMLCLLVLAFARRSVGEPFTNITAQVGFEQKISAQVPLGLRFVDENGNPVLLGKYFGRKPVLVTLVYFRCPMLCTEVLNGFQRALKPMGLSVGDDFEIVTVSINPEEGPMLAAQKKKSYLRVYTRPHAGEGWHWLTGKQESISELTKAVGFRYHYDEASKQYAHAAGFVVLTPSGKVSRYFFGIDYSPGELQSALQAAANEKSGRVIHELLLLCFHYDPATGKYSFTVIKTLRAAGVVTMITLFGSVFVLLRREHKRLNYQPQPDHPIIDACDH